MNADPKGHGQLMIAVAVIGGLFSIAAALIATDTISVNFSTGSAPSTPPASSTVTVTEQTADDPEAPSATACPDLIVGSGSQQSAYEPNDNVESAAGPLRAGRLYTRLKIENDEDRDWYALCFAELTQVALRVTLLDDNDQCLGFEATVYDETVDVDDPVDGPLYGLDENEVGELGWTAKPRRPYLVELHGGNFECSGGVYSLRVVPEP